MVRMHFSKDGKAACGAKLAERNVPRFVTRSRRDVDCENCKPLVLLAKAQDVFGDKE